MNIRDYKFLILPPGQSEDFDEGQATRQWLWPYLAGTHHLVGFTSAEVLPATTPPSSGDAVAFAMMHPSLELCVQFSDDGKHIRKWSRVPFEGGECLYSHPASDNAVREALDAAKKAEDAMREMFRYFDGGETRGSYDGKPERAGLRNAWYGLRSALATLAKRGGAEG